MRTFSRHMPESLSEALKVLRSGGCVIHATETCYGIACDLGNPVAVRHLFDVKKRPPDQPVSALFSSIDATRAYVEISPEAEALLQKYLPGPLTVILPRAKEAAPLWLTVNGDGKDPLIGVRISSHPFAQELVKAFGSPIATTSANIHGEANPYSIKDVESQWKSASMQPDLLIDSGALPVAPPSTVIRFTRGKFTVVRQGSTVVD